MNRFCSETGDPNIDTKRVKCASATTQIMDRVSTPEISFGPPRTAASEGSKLHSPVTSLQRSRRVHEQGFFKFHYLEFHLSIQCIFTNSSSIFIAVIEKNDYGFLVIDY